MNFRASRPPTACCGEVWEEPHASDKPQEGSKRSHNEQTLQKLSGQLQQRVLSINSAQRSSSPQRDKGAALPPVDEHLATNEREDDREKFGSSQSKSSEASKISEMRSTPAGSPWGSERSERKSALKASPPTKYATNSSQGSASSDHRSPILHTNSSQGSAGFDHKVIMGKSSSQNSGGSGGSWVRGSPQSFGDENVYNSDTNISSGMKSYHRVRSCCQAWFADAIKGEARSKPLSKRQRCFVLVTFGIFRTLSMALPLLVFAILMAGPESRAVARRVAGLSALVAICHGLLARSPLQAPNGQRPRRPEDLAVGLFEFADMACDYSFKDCLRLVEQASVEEVMALGLLIKLTRAEKIRSGIDGAPRRKEPLSQDRSRSFLSVTDSTGKSGTPAFGPRLSLDRSRSTFSTGSFASPGPSMVHVATGASAAPPMMHTATGISTTSSGARKVTFGAPTKRPVARQPSSVYGRSRSNLSSIHMTSEEKKSNYLRSRSNLSGISEDKERRPLLQKDLTRDRLNRSSSKISTYSASPGLRKSITSHSEISVTSFTDFNQRNSQFRIANGAVAGVKPTPLILPDEDLDKPARNESNMAVASGKLPMFGAGPTSGPMQTVTEEDSEGTKSDSKVGQPVANSDQADIRAGLQSQPTRTLFMELDLPVSSAGGSSAGGSRAGGSLGSTGSPGPSPADVKLRLPNSGEMQSAVDCVSDAGMTYVSTCDAVLGEGNSAGEVVSAEVVNLGKGIGGANRVRIEFKSQCLRTQNEWQRQLLNQQKSLMDAMSTELEVARNQLVSSDQLKLDQKELLRSFRKIVTREVATHAPQAPGSLALPQFSVCVFIVEEDEEVRAALEELCKMCDYACEAFGDFFSAMPAIKQWKDSNSSHNMSPKAGASSPRVSSRRPSQASSCKVVPLVLLGASMLPQISPGWKDEDLFVALTSQVEEFEEVGRQLLASGESEVRELLRKRGISEYLMHPMSMSCLRGVASEVLRKHFGEEYLLVDTIGRGATGVVYRAKRLRDGEVFALKEISIRRLGVRARQEVMTETALLVELSWPTLVYLVDAFVSNNEQLQYLLMPILEGGSLGQLRAAAEQEDCKISAEHAMEWYAQTVHGVSYLHWCGVLHRDLKPANLLLAADERVLQIGDLGSAARLPGPGPHPDCRSCVQKDITTIAYSSPETLTQRVHYSASDLWAVGVSFYEVFTLTLPHEPGELAHPFNTTFDPRALSSEGRDVATPIRAALHGSDLSDAGVIEEIARELEELMRADPFSRPTASSLTSRPGTERRLWNVLRETGAFEDSGTEADHLMDLAEIKRDAEQAASKVATDDVAPEVSDRCDAGQHTDGDGKPKQVPTSASMVGVSMTLPRDRCTMPGLRSI